MGCQATLDFAPPPSSDAHLSFYWTMDEGGVLDKVDSVAGVHWPLRFTAIAAAGLFVNGTDMPNPSIINQDPGLGVFSSTDITINQATSTGISVWFWVKKLTAKLDGVFTMDTSDVLHTNRFKIAFGPLDGTPVSGVNVEHTNDTDDVSISSPDLTWAIGSWHMIAGTYNKTDKTINVYVDGALAGSTMDAFTYPDLTSTDMTLVNTDFGSVTDGVVDELGLSTKGALTPTQVTALYNAGAGVTWPNITPIVPFP